MSLYKMFRKLFSNPSSERYNPASLKNLDMDLGSSKKKRDCEECDNELGTYKEIYENGLNILIIKSMFVTLEKCVLCRTDQDMKHFIDEFISFINTPDLISRAEIITYIVRQASININSKVEYFFNLFISLFVKYDKEINPETYKNPALDGAIQEMVKQEYNNRKKYNGTPEEKRETENRISLYKSYFQDRITKAAS